MFKKSQNNTYIGKLAISKENYDRILMWSQSMKEINFICFGKGKVIENVYRLSNISNLPENYSYISDYENEMLIKEKKKQGQIIMARGHSHPKKSHARHPSKDDVKYIRKGTIELIAFPGCSIVKAWKIEKSVKQTKKSEIILNIL